MTDEFGDEAATVSTDAPTLRDLGYEDTAVVVMDARRAATCPEWPPDPTPPASAAPRRAAILRAISEPQPD